MVFEKVIKMTFDMIEKLENEKKSIDNSIKSCPTSFISICNPGYVKDKEKKRQKIIKEIEALNQALAVLKGEQLEGSTNPKI